MGRRQRFGIYTYIDLTECQLFLFWISLVPNIILYCNINIMMRVGERNCTMYELYIHSV